MPHRSAISRSDVRRPEGANRSAVVSGSPPGGRCRWSSGQTLVTPGAGDVSPASSQTKHSFRWPTRVPRHERRDGDPGRHHRHDDPRPRAPPQPMYRDLLAGSDVLRVDGVGLIACSRAAVDEVLRQPDVFSSSTAAVDLKARRPLIPLQIDPPDHGKYRKILDPLFSPQRMRPLEEPIAAPGERLHRRLRRRRRDRLHRRVLHPVPVAGVPHPVRPAHRGVAAVPADEGRHHPPRPRGRPGAATRRPTPTSRRRPTRSTRYFEELLDERASVRRATTS